MSINPSKSYNNTLRIRSRRMLGDHPYKVEVEMNDWNDPYISPRIIGGKEAREGKYPFMASLSYQKNHVCGGSLITDDIVLSAAHCADFFEGVTVGRHDLGNDDEEYERFNIEKFVIHPRYQTSSSLVSSMDNDFMLIKLYGWSSKVDKPIVLNTDPGVPKVGESCDVVGWGVTNTKTEATSDVLKEVSVNVMTNSACEKKKGKMDGFSQLFSLEGKITPNMLCAADEGEDACQGDSGGPLILKVGQKKIQVGVVSWGLDCAHPIFPGVYSRVSSQFDWINKVVCDWAESPPDYFGCDKSTPDEDDDSIEKRTVTIEILLDRFPQETGFLLRSGKNNIAYGPIGVYAGKENKRMTVVLDLEVDKEYTFIMLDAYGDGLKFDGAKYRVWLADKPDKGELIIQGAHYERSIHHRFFLEPELDPTPNPTPLETAEPTEDDTDTGGSITEAPEPTDDENNGSESTSTPDPTDTGSEDDGYIVTAEPTQTPPISFDDSEYDDDPSVFSLSLAPTPILADPSKSGAGFYITIVIKLDNKPRETGWAVTRVDGQKLLQSRPVGYYKGKENSIVIEKVYLEQSNGNEDDYLVAFIDKGRNGLCCEQGPGFFQVFLGDISDGQILFSGESFRYMQQYEFSIEWDGGNNNRQSPTPSPKKFPLGPGPGYTSSGDVPSKSNNEPDQSQTSSSSKVNGQCSFLISMVLSIGLAMKLLFE